MDQISVGFHAVDANGSLFTRDWVDTWESVGPIAWETAGQEGTTSPVFPVIAWQQARPGIQGHQSQVGVGDEWRRH